MKARARRRSRHPLFDQSGARADLGFWAKASHWSSDEAAALSLGYAPLFVNSCTVKPHLGTSIKANEFDQRLMLILRALDVGALKPQFSPREFVIWADHVGLPLPKKLRDAIGAIGISDVTSETKIDELQRQIAVLKMELEQCKAANREAHPRERRSLQILVAGMAAGPYRFNPKADRNSATAAIVGDIERLGLSMDKDTVLTHLRCAFDELDIAPPDS